MLGTQLLKGSRENDPIGGGLLRGEDNSSKAAWEKDPDSRQFGNTLNRQVEAQQQRRETAEKAPDASAGPADEAQDHADPTPQADVDGVAERFERLGPEGKKRLLEQLQRGNLLPAGEFDENDKAQQDALQEVFTELVAAQKSSADDGAESEQVIDADGHAGNEYAGSKVSELETTDIAESEHKEWLSLFEQMHGYEARAAAKDDPAPIDASDRLSADSGDLLPGESAAGVGTGQSDPLAAGDPEDSILLTDEGNATARSELAGFGAAEQSPVRNLSAGEGGTDPISRGQGINLNSALQSSAPGTVSRGSQANLQPDSLQQDQQELGDSTPGEGVESELLVDPDIAGDGLSKLTTRADALRTFLGEAGMRKAADGAAQGTNLTGVDADTATAESSLTSTAGNEFRSALDQLKQAGGKPELQADALNMRQGQVEKALSEKMMFLIGRNIRAAEIKLDPPELGSMMIRIQVQQDQTQVHFSVTNSQARDALEQAMPRLREMLAQQGINLGSADVSQQGNRHAMGGESGNAEGDGTAQGRDADDNWRESEQAEDLSAVSYAAPGRIDFFA